MGPQRERLLRRRPEAPDEARPQQAGRTELRHLHEIVQADAEEEAEPRRERIDVEPRREPGADVVDAVRERIGELEVRRRPGLLHMVAGDRDRVEARHAGRRIGEDVADDAHRGSGRIDIGVPDHELLQDVVLDRAGELFGPNALVLRRHDVERHDGQDRAVHGHRHRHLVERNAVEEAAHVEDRVDRHPRPCRRRPQPSGDPNRSLGGSRGRRRPTGLSGRRRGCADRRRSRPRRSRSRHIAGSSQGWVVYMPR